MSDTVQLTLNPNAQLSVAEARIIRAIIVQQYTILKHQRLIVLYEHTSKGLFNLLVSLTPENATDIKSLAMDLEESRKASARDTTDESIRERLAEFVRDSFGDLIDSIVVTDDSQS